MCATATQVLILDEPDPDSAGSIGSAAQRLGRWYLLDQQGAAALEPRRRVVCTCSGKCLCLGEFLLVGNLFV